MFDSVFRIFYSPERRFRNLIESHRFKEASLLVNSKFDARRQIRHGESLLAQVARCVPSGDNLDIAGSLLTSSADPDFGALNVAVSNGDVDLISLLLDAGADPQQGIESAIRFREFDILEMLFDAGADPNLRDEAMAYEPITYQLVVRGDSESLERLLSRGADPNAWWKLEPQWNAFTDGIQFEADELRTYLIHAAAMHGSVSTLESLIAHGANPNFQEHGGMTALMKCSWQTSGLIAPIPEVEQSQLTKAKILVAAGADPSLSDSGGHDALWWAKTLNNKAVGRYLISLRTPER